MKKCIGLIISLIVSLVGFSQPANDDCANASTLTINAGLICGEDAASASLEGGECYTNYSGGSSESSMWYRITANNDSLVFNFIESNNTNCAPHVAIYGPFAPGGGCNPACASQIYDALQTGDPGHHTLLTGLTSGQDYLIQVQNNSCGGPGPGDIQFCIGVTEPSPNAQSSGATLIDECGTAFNETTDGGYWQSGTGTGFANLDNNAGTTCGGCLAGNDVSFVINNAAWNTFCSLTTGTWQITVDNVANCALSGAGIQAAVFTGTTAALVNEGQQSPIGVGGSWTSPTISVNSGECAYLMLDGFAGDACDYTVTLTNITGGCTILPVEFESFDVVRTTEQTYFSWTLSSELNNEKFIIEESLDGDSFTPVIEVQSIGDHTHEHTYDYLHQERNDKNKYYRLSSIDQQGNKNILSMKYLKGNVADAEIQLFPNPASEKFTLLYPAFKDESLKIELYGLNGRLVHSSEAKAIKGSNQIDIDIVGLPSGQYLVRIISDSRLFNDRLQID